MNDHTEGRAWLVRGRVRIREVHYDRRSSWVAEDERGVVALAPDKDSLIRLLQEDGTSL